MNRGHAGYFVSRRELTHFWLFVLRAISQGLLEEQARDADRSGESIARNRHYPLKGGITINNGVLHLKICAKSRILENIIKRKVSASKLRKHFIIARASLSICIHIYKDF